MEDLWKRARCQGKDVVTALAPWDLQMLSVSYNVPSGQNETQSLLKHLKDRMRQDLGESVIDWLPIRQGPNESMTTKSALVAVAPKSQVMSHLDLLVSAGLNPLAVDIGPAALARLVRVSLPVDKWPNVLLINFGREGSFISMLWGRRLMLDRGVGFGESLLVKVISRNLDLSEDEAADMLQRYGVDSSDEVGETISDMLQPEFAELVREISRILVYFAAQTHGGTMDEVRILGTLSEYPGMAEKLTQHLQVPVTLLDPGSILKFSAKAKAPDALFGGTSLAVAAGLALRGRTVNDKH